MRNNSEIHINMLGEFSITYDSVTISDQITHAKKPFLLLQYLIAYRNKEISQMELIDLLWPDDTSDNPSGALKTLLHRVRRMLAILPIETPLIKWQRGSYAFNTDIPVVIDTDLFEDMCKKGLQTENKEQKLSYYLQAINFYGGDFLPKSSLETWVIPITAYYHSLYLKIVHECIGLLIETKDFEQIEKICYQALVIDSYDEELHYQLVYALSEHGKDHEALEHYNQVNELFMNRFGITPSKHFTSLYTRIQSKTHGTEENLQIIRTNLKEASASKGAFFCEYVIFRNIYQLEARAANRTGESIYLCLFTIESKYSKKLYQETINHAMELLKECISSSLRSSDIYSRYSINQYILMLPVTNYETADMVLKRIAQSFKRVSTKLPIKYSYKLLPIEALN